MRSGFLIRFIDLGLIILFGFIMITDIENYSVIPMGGEDAPPAEEPLSPPTALGVHIASSGLFSIVDLSTRTVLAAEVEGLGPLEERLRQVRTSVRRAGGTMVVYIDPHASSIVQHTVDVMDVCDRLGVAKNLQVAALAP